MLTLIKDRLTEENTVCDEVMLHAWSLLWNVTGLSVCVCVCHTRTYFVMRHVTPSLES